MKYSISIVPLKENSMVDSLTLDVFDKLHVNLNNFKNNIGTYDDALTKTQYIFLKMKNIKGINKKELTEVLKEYTGAKNIVIDEDKYDAECIDNIEKMSINSIRDFIFNPKSLLVIHK